MLSKQSDCIKGALLVVQGWLMAGIAEYVKVIEFVSKMAKLFAPMITDFFYLVGSMSAAYGMYKMYKKKE